ncbi:hypothetical protein NPIL_601871 [Nephila pilipes]|uniref:Uncharacterized protein n=1 Tax=Nephila pilipes TaxID=299642 RepID=A0A8X6NCY6_NEPPI|nr:hypothetical protein NPIL_601871 [Nephila pilipes]
MNVLFYHIRYCLHHSGLEASTFVEDLSNLNVLMLDGVGVWGVVYLAQGQWLALKFGSLTRSPLSLLLFLIAKLINYQYISTFCSPMYRYIFFKCIEEAVKMSV